MKSVLKRSLSLLLAITIIFSSAYVGLSEVDFGGLFAVKTKAASTTDLTFTLSSDGLSYSVTDCKQSASGEIVIPSTYNGLPVTSIGESAFSGCTSLTSVTVPDSVTSIGASAFYNCNKITSFIIPNGVTSISDSAFAVCSNLTSITIPDGVTRIGHYSFRSCTSLTSITIPNSVISVGDYAFYNTNLTDVYYGGTQSDWSNISIGSANGYLTNATIHYIVDVLTFELNSDGESYSVTDCDTSASGEIVIPSTYQGLPVTSIGDCAFESCEGLTSIIIPDSVTSIGEFAFVCCTSITSIIIPNSITSIGDAAFNSCYKLASITIPDSVTSIGVEAFGDCDSLTSVVIPGSVTILGSGTFLNCDNLESATIPEGITKIDHGTFGWCEKLTSIVIPDSVKTIGFSAFDGCTSLESIILPDSLTSIGENAFNCCPSLTSVTIPDSVNEIGSYAFNNCTNLETIAIGAGITSFGTDVFGECVNIKTVVFADGATTTIPENMFKDCTNLESITLPDSIIGIGKESFYNTAYYNNTDNWENGVLYIGNHLIYAKESRDFNYKFVVKDGTKTIADSAITQTINSEGILIPDSVTNIGKGAIDTCFMFVFYKGTEEQWQNINIGSDNTLYSIHYESTDHTISDWIVETEPSCTNYGYRYKECVVCKYPLVEEYPDMEKHTPGDLIYDRRPTCTEAGEGCHHCTKCGQCLGFETIPATGHNYSTEWTVDVQPTCTTSGSKSRHCLNSNCDSESKIDIIEILPLGHTLTDWIIDKDATCTEAGSKHKECTVCGETVETVEIPATEHPQSDWIIETQATCTENGLKYKECTECGVVLEVVTIIASGHIHNDWVIDSSLETKYRECTACGETQTEKLIVTGLSIIELPQNTTFVRGTTFDFTGLKVQMECADGLTKIIDVTADMTTGGDINNVGTQTIVYTVGDYSVSFDVNVVYQSVKALTIESMPDKTSYIEGQTIDTTGLVIKAEYEDGTTEDITDFDLQYDNTLVGQQDVIVRFSDATVTFPVTFTSKKLVSIAVTKMPNKTTYVVGDSFDNTGMVVTATYDNGLSEAVTDYAVSTLPKTAGTKNLIVSFGGKKVIIKVTVVEKAAVSMEVVEPEKFEYISGEDFDPTGMVVNVTFNNGDVEEVTDYTIEGFGDFIGVGVVTVNYSGLTYDLIIIMHSPEENWVVDTEATCTTDGVKHLYCTECGEIVKTETILATGHDYDEKVIKEATCTEDGLLEGKTCKTCGEVISGQTVVPALGHDYSVEFIVDVEPTCKTEGSKSRHCSRCDDKTDITVVESDGHSYSDWNVTIEATCDVGGERTRSCSDCGETFIETIDALGHVYSVIWTTDKTPTCSVPGSKSHHCNRCGDRTDITEIEPLGHNFGDWTELETPDCTTEGQRVRMCSVCYSEDVEAIPALGHSYGEWFVDSKADCENDGVRHAICDVCKFVNNETIKAYGHDYESVFTVDKEATCTEEGSKSHHCSRCDSVADETVILALGHHISTMWTIDTEPTCESVGSKSHHCLRCDVKSDITVIPVASHIYGKWEVITPATMDVDGVRAHKCYNCEMTEEDIIPKLLKYTATFVADGDIVATVDFPEGASEIEIPEVPHKDKYNGEWENFDVQNKNFTINAVYTPISTGDINGIKANNTADYYSSTGEVEVNLNISASGKTVITTTTKAIPLDIVFVLDQSGSMAENGKKDVLKTAVTTFSNAILEDAIANSVDHRIAVVGFASGGNDRLNYENTELLTADVVKYNKLSQADYKNALVSVNDNGALNSVITKAVNAIDAEGATKADLGLEMASNIFANNPVTDNRQRVVVFLTDGVPTSYSNFEYGVANAAIQNAYQLKDTYDATVYSVGVFDEDTSSNNSVNNFMNYVSSNYNEEKVLKKHSTEASENTNGYYLSVSDVSSLSDVFTSIVEETVTHTGKFTNATLKYTLSKYFTLTSVQEDTLRLSAIESLGVTNDEISITRNADGTTTIVISNIEPWANGEVQVIDFTFRATANENTLKSGTYQVGTYNSGVILENGEGFEAVFVPKSVDIGGTSGIAVFNINNIPYAINRLSSTTMVTAPATDFGADYSFTGWSVPANLTLNNEVRVFDAELTKNEYKISWNIDGKIIEVTYSVGDFISVPEVGNNSIGGAFVGWDKDIPETMPSENLTITAIYDAHYHKYAVTKDFETCDQGGTLTYTCECGDSYTEEIAPTEHTWEAITGATNHKHHHSVGFRCTVCGVQDDKDLDLERKEKKENTDNSYNTATYEFNYVDDNGKNQQPDGDVEISVQLDDVFEGDIPEDANASVYRVNDDGSRTKLDSECDGMNIKFKTDHFSTYVFEFDSGEQKYIFGENDTIVDYTNMLIFTNSYCEADFVNLVTYLSPAKLTVNHPEGRFFATGSSIAVSGDDVLQNYMVIVNGDVNGDSMCDALDCFDVERASNGNTELTGAYAMAADSNSDDAIDITDYQAIVNQALS